jgi:hypothetical protein
MSYPDEPAFPTPDSKQMDAQPGMSLRDYFAGQALIALIDKEQSPHRQMNAGTLASVIAEEAYAYAEAMLNESVDNAV